MTILVVDDEPATPRLFEQRFRHAIRQGQLRFVFASTGLDALKRLEDVPAIALVLTDINMPGMSGIELLQRIRQKKLSPPVYVVSAYDGSDYEKVAREHGAAGFLPKPLRFEDLNQLFEISK